MNYPRKIAALGIVGCAIGLASCSILEPEESGLGPDESIEVSSSETPDFEPQDVKEKKVTSNLAQPVEDKGLNVEFEHQGVYADDVAGTVVTVKITNLNDVPLPPDALDEPELRDGNGDKIDALPYDPEVNTNIAAPGLDRPLGVGASTNLQYRFDVTPGNLWDATFSLGNITWSGDLNL